MPAHRRARRQPGRGRGRQHDRALWRRRSTSTTARRRSPTAGRRPRARWPTPRRPAPTLHLRQGRHRRRSPLSVSDGDAACASHQSVDVICSEPPPHDARSSTSSSSSARTAPSITRSAPTCRAPVRRCRTCSRRGSSTPTARPARTSRWPRRPRPRAAGRLLHRRRPARRRTRSCRRPAPSGAPSAPRTTAPPFVTTVDLAAETDIDRRGLVPADHRRDRAAGARARHPRHQRRQPAATARSR